MIDTLKAVDTLKEHGFNEEKARAIAHLVTSRNEELATKADIYGTNTRIDGLQPHIDALHTRIDGLQSHIDALHTRIDGLQSHIDALHTRIDGLESRISTSMWMIGISLILNTVAIAGIITILISR